MVLKWLMVINPASGGGRAKKKWKKQIKPYLEKLRVDFDDYFTQGPEDAISFVKDNVSQYDGVVAVGGDGTSNEVINGIIKGTLEKGLKNDKYFLVIPAGTGNDIANALNMPYKDITASCDLLDPEITPKEKYTDVGKVTGTTFSNETITRYFSGVLSVGFDASVAYKSKDSKFLPGTASYVKALLTNIIWLKSIDFNLKLKKEDEIKELNEHGVLLAIGIGQYYGAGMKICPDAVIDDGLFDLTFLKKIPRRTLLRVFPKVYSGNHVSHPAVILERASVIDITTNEDTLWQVDGEVIGHPPLKAEVLPKALKVLIP